MNKVAFAGKPKPQPSAADLFKQGKDTVEIAASLGISEAQASNRIFIERCKRRGLAMGFETNHRNRVARVVRVRRSA